MILYDMGVADYCQEENRKRPLLRNPNLIRAILFYHALKSFYLAYLCSETIVSPRNDLIFIVLGDFGYIWHNRYHHNVGAIIFILQLLSSYRKYYSIKMEPKFAKIMSVLSGSFKIDSIDLDYECACNLAKRLKLIMLIWNPMNKLAFPIGAIIVFIIYLLNRSLAESLTFGLIKSLEFSYVSYLSFSIPFWFMVNFYIIVDYLSLRQKAFNKHIKDKTDYYWSVHSTIMISSFGRFTFSIRPFRWVLL